MAANSDDLQQIRRVYQDIDNLLKMMASKNIEINKSNEADKISLFALNNDFPDIFNALQSKIRVLQVTEAPVAPTAPVAPEAPIAPVYSNISGAAGLTGALQGRNLKKVSDKNSANTQTKGVINPSVAGQARNFNPQEILHAQLKKTRDTHMSPKNDKGGAGAQGAAVFNPQQALQVQLKSKGNAGSAKENGSAAHQKLILPKEEHWETFVSENLFGIRSRKTFFTDNNITDEKIQKSIIAEVNEKLKTKKLNMQPKKMPGK